MCIGNSTAATMHAAMPAGPRKTRIQVGVASVNRKYRTPAIGRARSIMYIIRLAPWSLESAVMMPIISMTSMTHPKPHASFPFIFMP